MEKSKALEIVRSQLKTSQRGLGDQYKNTQKCIEFYNGDTMSYRDRVQFQDTLGRKKVATVQFNEVQTYIDSVAGFMAQNRRRAKYFARVESADQQKIYSKYMNSIYDYVRENANTDHVETDQDVDMLINGYGAVETDISYIVGNATTDPNGEVLNFRLEADKVGWDPSAVAKNFLDARWVYYFKEFDLKDAVELFDANESDFGDADPENETGYQYNPYGGVYDKIKFEDSVEWADKNADRVKVYKHQWFEFETFFRAENPIYNTETPEQAMYIKGVLEQMILAQTHVGPDNAQISDMFEFSPTDEIFSLSKKQRDIFVKNFPDATKPVAFKRKVYYTAVYSGTHIFDVFKSISQQGFSVKFKTGSYDASKKIWTGMVNPMMEPVEYKNKALTELMFAIAANSKGGVIIESDAVEDQVEFNESWAKTDAVITVNPGALGQGKIQDKARPAVPTGLDGIIALCDANMQKNGVDPSFVGDIGDVQQSGVLYKRRIRQAISKMARYFDSITLYQKETARHCADLIRVWVENNNGQFIRITGAEFADQFIQLNSESIAPEYDVTIQEAPQTPEDRRETADVLGTFGDKMASLGNNAAASAFYLESVQQLPIDEDVRSRLIAALKPQEQPNTGVPQEVVAEMQAQIDALMSDITQMQLEKTKTEIELNKAKTEAEKIKSGKVQADTVKVLEEASRVGYENDLVKTGNFDTVNVSI